MNRDILEGNWKQLKGNVQKQWGQLTDDDLDVIEGQRTVLVSAVSRFDVPMFTYGDGCGGYAPRINSCPIIDDGRARAARTSRSWGSAPGPALAVRQPSGM